MKVSLTQYASLARDANGNVMPLGKNRLSCQVLTAAGSFTALDSSARFVRIATDTAIHIDVAGGTTNASDELFLANSVEYFAVNGSEVLAVALA